MSFLDDFIAEDAYLALSKIVGGLSLLDVIGDVYWVDSSDTAAVDTSGRGAINAPFATLAYAINQCTADNDDVIAVKEGHDETATADIDLNKAGTSIVGVTRGANLPIIRFTDTAHSLVMSVADCRVSSLKLVCEVNSQGSMIEIGASGDGSIVDHCEFTTGTTLANRPSFVIEIVGDAEDVIIAYNRMLMQRTTGAVSKAIHADAAVCDNLRVIGNVILGPFDSVASIDLENASDHLLIMKNRIVNTSDVAQNIINLHASSFGFIGLNQGHTGFDDSGAAYAPDLDGVIKQGACACCQNFFSNEIDEAAGLTPGTVAS